MILVHRFLEMSNCHKAPASLLYLMLPTLRAQLTTALHHILSFRSYLGSLSPSDEKARLANDLLKETFDSGSIMWRALYTELENIKNDESCAISGACHYLL
jgi:hypothetical protein